MICCNIFNKINFSKVLIDKTRIATVPGFSFYSKKEMGKNQVRFTFCKKDETLNIVSEKLKTLH